MSTSSVLPGGSSASSIQGERPVREVPQRPLALDRLVDDSRRLAVESDRALERTVRRGHQPAEQGQLATGEQVRVDHSRTCLR